MFLYSKQNGKTNLYDTSTGVLRTYDMVGKRENKVDLELSIRESQAYSVVSIVSVLKSNGKLFLATIENDKLTEYEPKFSYSELVVGLEKLGLFLSVVRESSVIENIKYEQLIFIYSPTINLIRLLGQI